MTDHVVDANKMVLSPAAQAVASVYDDTPEKDTGNHRYLWLAAALRAAADQVVPEDFDYWDGRDGEYWADYELGQNERNAYVRSQLLAIADELEVIT